VSTDGRHEERLSYWIEVEPVPTFDFVKGCFIIGLNDHGLFVDYAIYLVFESSKSTGILQENRISDFPPLLSYLVTNAGENQLVLAISNQLLLMTELSSRSRGRVCQNTVS
jgi:hypothetical protein